MVHGGFRPCSAAFDCPFPGYSLMKALAGAGYDMFALDMTGHDHSTLPLQANPANISPEDSADLAALTSVSLRKPVRSPKVTL